MSRSPNQDETRSAAHGRRRIFSGIQPSGSLHLGNYLGAIRQWVRRQDERSDEVESFICVVDLHAITLPQDPESLRRQTRELFALLIACGIDPERTTLFVQSHVRAHTEATWMLLCATPLGWLERMTQYKVKAQRQESVGAGLLTYPVLQAADILLYDAHEVPVGEDQKQHVELCRDVAQRFNHLYGETFVVPEPVIPQVGARIMGLDDPSAKMSKSDSAARGHAVLLTDPDAEIERAIKRAVTDSGNEIRFSDDPEKAGVDNLLSIYAAVTGRSRAECEADFADARGYGDLKKRVAEVVVDVVGPIRERAAELLRGDHRELDRLVALGAERAAAIAEPKLAQMRERLGFLPAPR
ncbi:MAG: tryptophan--tRNA ligase [Acidobacteria bacterium]|nr:MAG: tryptophan--tRNA ligase [Acidobacteriota bacterium]REK01130.1 MAG: tryptophan--tRNA ligase [Acidobacteriota bacterium]